MWRAAQNTRGPLCHSNEACPSSCSEACRGVKQVPEKRSWDQWERVASAARHVVDLHDQGKASRSWML